MRISYKNKNTSSMNTIENVKHGSIFEIDEPISIDIKNSNLMNK